MAGFFGKWSRTAASNSTADSTVNWAEGQAPSSVNDSARAMMASIASWRDDRSGSLVCGGTSTAYTLTTNQVYASLADMDGQEISFVVTPTNGADATLNVNGLGAKALVFSIGNAMPAASLVDGSIYTATYVSASNVWKVHSVTGNPYNIPIGGGMDYWGTTVPNSNFAFPIGQAISRTTYSALFAIMSTTYGVGDGSTTFNLPDKTGRVSAMKESSATRLTSTYFGASGATMGATGGGESSTLVTGNLPAYTPAGTVSNGAITFPSSRVSSVATGGTSAITTGSDAGGGSLTTALGPSQASSTFTGTAQGGTSTPVRTVQPTIVCQYIIRII